MTRGPVPDPDNFWRCYICGDGGSPASSYADHLATRHPVKPTRKTDPEPIPEGQLLLFGEDTA